MKAGSQTHNGLRPFPSGFHYLIETLRLQATVAFDMIHDFTKLYCPTDGKIGHVMSPHDPREAEDKAGEITTFFSCFLFVSTFVASFKFLTWSCTPVLNVLPIHIYK